MHVRNDYCRVKYNTPSQGGEFISFILIIFATSCNPSVVLVVQQRCHHSLQLNSLLSNSSQILTICGSNLAENLIATAVMTSLSYN